MAPLEDSLRRAHREHDAALARGDEESANLIAQAIAVLEQGQDGKLVPRQRPAED